MRLTLLALPLIFAVSLNAGEAEIKNAEEFLGTLKEVKKEVCKRQVYRAMTRGMLVGSADISISASECDKRECYCVSYQMAVKVGERSFSHIGVDYVAPDLTLLYSESQSRENGERDGSSATTFDGKQYTHAKTTKDGKCTSTIFEKRARLLHGFAEELAALLVPRDTKRTYEFADWDDESGLQNQQIEVKDATSIGRHNGIRVARRYKATKKNRSGASELKSFTDEMLVTSEGTLIYQYLDSPSVTLEQDDGDTSIETIKAFARPIDPILGWARAFATQDSELLGEAMNLDAYVEEVIRRDAKLENKTEAELNLFRSFLKEDFAKKWVEKTDMSERAKALYAGMSSDDFDMKFEHSDRVKLVLNEHFRKRTGDKSILFFIVERDADSGKWKFVWLATEDDEF